MFETALHRRVALAVALAALALTGAVAGAPGTTSADVSTSTGPSVESVDVSAERTGDLGPEDVSLASADANVTINHDGPVVLRAAPNQRVSVQSDAAAGTETTVTIRSPRHNLLRSSEVTVGDDGTGTATFNLSDVESGTSFTVTARDSAATIDGVVVAESATVHRDGTFSVSDPASDYALRGEVLGFATRLDLDLAVEGTTHSETVTVGEDDTFAASFDLSSVASGAEATVEAGGIPRTANTVVATGASGEPTAYVLLEPANATIRHPEETLLVHPDTDQTVRGTTNLRPGTELTVTAVNDDLNSPDAFERTDTVTVREDGTFVAELNVTGVEPGTNFSVAAGPGLARMHGRVVNESVTLPTVTTTEATTQSTTDESAFTNGTTTPDEGSDGHVDEFVPGFGLPAALIALVAALALARRNRR
jgi:PGF-CTERM protein